MLLTQLKALDKQLSDFFEKFPSCSHALRNRIGAKNYLAALRMADRVAGANAQAIPQVAFDTVVVEP